MIKAGKKYRHFKGDIMEIIAIAKHTETTLIKIEISIILYPFLLNIKKEHLIL